jgi:hypothetical protein
VSFSADEAAASPLRAVSVSEQFLKQPIYAARKFPSQPAHFEPNDHELT